MLKIKKENTVYNDIMLNASTQFNLQAFVSDN